MKKLHHFLVTILLLGHLQVSAQTAITIQPATSFVVKANTPVYLNGLVLNPTADYSFNAPNALAHNTTINHPSPNAYIGRVYKWTNTLPAFSGTVIVNYLDGELNSIAEANLTLNIHDGSSWDAYVTGVIRNGISNSVTTTVNNLALQELTLTGLLNPLPLQWGPVKAYRKGSLAYIEWSAIHESDISHYEIQKSTNGANWQQINTRIPAVNAGTHRYIEADSGITTSRTFYRIQQVSPDNHLSMSPVVAVEAVSDGFTAHIFPNPVSNRLTVRSESALNIQSISVYTTNGTWLLRRQVNASAYQLDVSAWLPGPYLLQVTGADGKINHHTLIKK